MLPALCGVNLVLLGAFFTGEPAAYPEGHKQFSPDPSLLGVGEPGNKQIWRYAQGRRDDRILPTLKIAGKAFVMAPLLWAAIYDPSGPPDLLPLGVSPNLLITRLFPAQRRRKREIGKKSEYKTRAARQKGPNGSQIAATERNVHDENLICDFERWEDSV